MHSVKLTALFLMLALPLSAAGSDEAAYKNILLKSHTLKAAEFISEARSFLTAFPESDHIPDIRLLIADNETSPDKALAQYRAVRDKYRYADRRDYASLRIIQIFFLTSRFADCAEEGIAALDMFPQSKYRDETAMTVLRAYYCMQQYDTASAFLDTYPLKNTEAETLRIDLQLKLGALSVSQPWLVNLKTAQYPESALYRAGREFETDRKINEAFSAYTDCIQNYPRSAESLLCEKRIEVLKKSGAVYVKNYAALKKHEKNQLKITPEKDIEDQNDSQMYAVMIGPFYNLQEAKDLKKEMTIEFGRAVIVKQAKEFIIYAGKTSDQEAAVALKIRLAEEFGLNGTIVNFKKEDNREYIYGR